METPKSSSRRIKPRKYVPTPKMSERKKALFASNDGSSDVSMNYESDVDSDLGVMSPLQCSSSPSRYDSDDSGHLSFTEVLSTKSCLNSGRKSTKTKYESRFTDSGKYEFVALSVKPNLYDVVEETEVHTPTKLRLTNTWVDMSKVTDPSAPIILLTPGDTSTKEKAPKLSFRKSMIDKDGDTTPHVDDQPVKRYRSEEVKDSKARTSLFNESTISTKSFYSHNNDSFELKTESPNCSILKDIRKTKSFVPKIVTRKHKRPAHRTSKQNDINRGVFHKIHKQRTKKVVKNKKKSISKMTKTQILEAAMEIIDNSPLNAYLSSSSDDDEERKKRHRVQNILKNMKNPIELARPLNIELANNCNFFSDVSDNEESDAGVPLLQEILRSSPTPVSNQKENRKFFKSKTEKRAKYEIMKGVSAILDQGKLSLEKPVVAPKKRKLRSLFDDDNEFGEEQQEVNQLLKNLDKNDPRSPLKDRNVLMSPTTTQITSLATKFAALNPVSNVSERKVFPIFEKGHTSAEPSLEPQPKRMKVNEWRPIGDDQLQIDAGQKEFGAIECKTCGFTYTQHVPEDEQLHKQFHNSCQILNFKGWEKENRVLEIYEWGVSGRIIAILNSDPKSKLQRAQEILKVADMELGFAQIPLHPNAIIYLACNGKEVMGVCVAQPLYFANKLISDFGIDFCSAETYPVKCGISRIWVNAKHRRKGVATKLFEAVKCHFRYGCRLMNDEIAFSAPTEMGKTFAEKVTGKKDFLVYQ